MTRAKHVLSEAEEAQRAPSIKIMAKNSKPENPKFETNPNDQKKKTRNPKHEARNKFKMMQNETTTMLQTGQIDFTV